MPAPVALEVRRAIVKAYESGLGTYETVADLLGVGRATVSRILRLNREQESVRPKPRAGGPPPPIGRHDEARLDTIIRDHPGATLEELSRIWHKVVKKRISRSSLHRELDRLGYSRKKRIRAVERQLPKVKAKVKIFRKKISNVPSEKLVFLDESGCQEHIQREDIGQKSTCQRSPTGQSTETKMLR